MKKPILKLFLFLLVFGCTTKESEVFILPKGYTGYVVVIFGQEEGSEKRYENGKRVYEIPPSGILKTQFKSDYGRSDFPEFYYKNIQEANRIPYSYDFENLSENMIVGFGGQSGVTNRDLKGNSVVRYRKFYVGNKSQIRTAVEEAERLDIISIADKE